MEIGKYLLAEKEDVSLSMVLLNTLAYSRDSYAEPFILDFIRWCRETGRDKNEVSYSYAGVKYSVLIYNNALFALSMAGGKNALEFFSKDIVQDECRTKLTAFLCVNVLINRNVITIEEAEEVVGISLKQITKDLCAVAMRDLSGSDVRGQKNAADCMSTLLERGFILVKDLDFRAIKNSLFYLRCQNDSELRWSGDHLLYMIKIKTNPQDITYPYRDFSVHFPLWAAISAGVLAIMGVYFARMVRQPDSGI